MNPASADSSTPQTVNPKTIYDAIVVGSGATGGIAAKELSQRGLKVLVLEAGRDISPSDLANGPKEMAKRVYNLLTKEQGVQAQHPGYWKANPDLFTNEKQNPYSTPEGKPFTWVRGRQVGGKSLTWGGITLRLSDYEFKAASRDGHGMDWPISYDDLAPYYSQLEQFLQVRGDRNNLPQLPDGDYQLPPAELTPAEQVLKQLVEENYDDRELIISRGFSLHKPTPEQPWPPSSSQGAALKTAIDSGNVTLQSGAVVSHLIFDPETRKARGVAYVDRETKQPREVLAKTIFLCASAIESTRILLHSTEQHQPHGLANESDCLGRYLMDHVSTTQFFHWPDSPMAEQTQEMSGSHSFFLPCFVNLEEQTENFKRGYGLWGGVQRFDMPSLIKKVGKGAIGFLIAHGEVLPRAENRITLDSATDAWGIPIPHIDCAWSDNELNMLAHMHDQIEALVSLAGGQCLRLNELFHIPVLSEYVKRMEKTMSFSAPPGFYIHEVGGARMGSSPSNSVVNSHNQLWEAPNVFVTDGACWPSSGWQSPTLTEMAVTARACDFAAIALQQGKL